MKKRSSKYKYKINDATICIIMWCLKYMQYSSGACRNMEEQISVRRKNGSN